MSKTTKKKSKLKNYKILMIGYCNVLVIKAKSEQEAMDFAWDGLNRGDFQIEEGRCCGEVSEERLEDAKNYVDCVLEE